MMLNMGNHPIMLGQYPIFMSSVRVRGQHHQAFHQGMDKSASPLVVANVPNEPYTNQLTKPIPLVHTLWLPLEEGYEEQQAWRHLPQSAYERGIYKHSRR